MQQLSQKLKDGAMHILEVPAPVLGGGAILVRNHYSLVSAGTEGSTVRTARKGLIGKAKERPQQVKQVLDTLKSQGPVQTYRAVMKKLDAYSPLGYSCAGEVIDVAEDVSEFNVGDKVACGGLTASHAEVVCVPVNLCVKLEPDADLRLAAYNTLGAIALQGVRQADLRLGETCAVIGLGLIGQLTGLLLRASGIRTVGVDIDPQMVDVAGKHFADLALVRNDTGIIHRIFDYTDGLGCDAAIITAATSSLDPINFAGAISRKRGTVVVVGAVPTGFDREPHYYKKELQVKMSCSYGPGRYDPEYEEKGIDYPAAYVRWTEKRNMQAFQDLLYSGTVDASHLTTSTFTLDDAPAAYDMMMAHSEPFIGILIAYDIQKKIERRPVFVNPQSASRKPTSVTIGFIGAGSYAQSHLLPNIPADEDVVLKGVMTSSGATGRSVAERFGFEFCSGQGTDIIDNPDINTVFVATRHDSHAGYVVKALKAGKHVFVEKPLCLTAEELREINDVIYRNSRGSTEGGARPILMVGYNRRFSPLARMLKQEFGDGPLAMTYRVNAGHIPAESWIQIPDIGGGRIVGEVCHFVDVLTYLNGSLPDSVYACALPDPDNLKDTLSVSLTFENGSIGTISYFSNGDKTLSKERIEVFGHSGAAILKDFKELHVYKGGKKHSKKLFVQDKGQNAEVTYFLRAAAEGGDAPIPLRELLSTSAVCFNILRSLKTKKRLECQ